jgi:hypothetical protein
MTDHPPICWLCRAPITGEPPSVVNHVSWPSEDTKAHGKCADAWLNCAADALKSFRDEACAAGHHRYPGAWSADPADPFGDAGMWECAKGCGFVQRHPGYGVGRVLADLIVAANGGAR